MTGAAFIQAVMFDLGKIQVVDTDTNYRLMVLNWLNRVLKDISTRDPHWRFLEKTATFNTIEDQMSYDLPEDIDTTRVFSLKQTTSPTYLRYMDQGRFDQLEARPTDASGDPFIYTLWSDSLRLWPVPSQVIAIIMRYIKTITELEDSDTSTTDVPSKYDNVVVDGVKAFAYAYEPGWGDRAQQIQIYEAGIQRMIRDNIDIIDDDGITENHPFGDAKLKQPYSFDLTSVG